MAWLQFNPFIFEETSKIVVHIRKDHVNRQRILLAASNNEHIQNFNDTRMFQCLEDFNFPESSHRHAFLFVMHKNPFQSD